MNEHEAHNANLATGLEHEACQCLERFMRENGHPEAKRYCSTLYVPDGNGGMLEVDGVVMADNCAMILDQELVKRGSGNTTRAPPQNHTVSPLQG